MALVFRSSSSVMTYSLLNAAEFPRPQATPESCRSKPNEGKCNEGMVVDDEVAVRKLIVRNLVQLGFVCDMAADGVEAEARVAQAGYDAVITDLKMPNKHGHALAVHLLTLNPRPVIVIHTGLIEPKLAKDLFARGVDDIVFKPFDFGILAAKVLALVERTAHGRPARQVRRKSPTTTGMRRSTTARRLPKRSVWRISKAGCWGCRRFCRSRPPAWTSTT